MPTSRTAEIVIRCIAVYAVVPFVNSLADWLTIVFESGAPASAQVPLLVATLLRLVLVVLLWLLAPAIGRRLATVGQSPHAALGLGDIAPLGFGLVGLTLAVLALPNIAVGAADLLSTSGMLPALGAGPLWGGIVQLVAGLGVFVGGPAIARAFVAVRRA
jgi:hypothetical protein